MKNSYPIILTPADGGYVVFIPDFQINTEGDSLTEAIEMARDAIGLTGEKIALNVKSEAAIKPNTTNPVAALVAVKVEVTDPNQCIHMVIETITGVTVSTFIDDIEQYIKDNYMSVILMSANEKIRSVSALIGVPIRIPNPRFGISPMVEKDESDILPQ